MQSHAFRQSTTAEALAGVEFGTSPPNNGLKCYSGMRTIGLHTSRLMHSNCSPERKPDCTVPEKVKQETRSLAFVPALTLTRKRLLPVNNISLGWWPKKKKQIGLPRLKPAHARRKDRLCQHAYVRTKPTIFTNSRLSSVKKVGRKEGRMLPCA